ncbi:MAG: ATP-binding protein [Candidatus Rokuibacteriota bacterium]
MASTYTPRYLAEKVLTLRSALEGERKQVTVLFVDIVDSSRLAERLDLEVVHELMDRVLRLMAEAVHRYQGTVNQFLGDGLMALFGAPIALEDHAVRATQAALAIQETVEAYSRKFAEEHGMELRLRLGLNSGPVVVGKIGDDLRMDYTAVGDTTNLADRMQELAEPGAILMTEATHRLVAGYVKSEPLGPIILKGRREPVSVFRLTGRRRLRTRLEVSVEAGLTDLVDRTRELQVLRESFARAKDGRGQVVALVGEPGVGKSRLLHEFRRSLENERLIWLEGHCVAYGQATPYLPVLDMCRANFQIEDGDNPLQIEAKLRQGVRAIDPELERILPNLRELFGVAGEHDVLAHLDPKERRRQMFEAIRTLTLAGGQRQVQVFVFEDLQWIDQTSEEYLDFVVESLAAIPALLLTTHRPGATIRWADKAYFTRLDLELFGEKEMQTLVGHVLGGGPAPPDVVRVIQEKADGNPLFVEEITKSLRERGVLVERAGEHVWSPHTTVSVPGTIKDIVTARLDHLQESVKRTLQIAAVIGRQFGIELLTQVSEHEHEVPHHLEILKRLELISETRAFPELEYAFKHALIQDVAYESLLRARRQELHEAVGGAIERLYADRLDEQASLLAHHYSRSARPDRMIDWALLAGDRAARLYANAEATLYYEQALETARALGAPGASAAEIDAVVRLAAVGATHRDVIERDLANLERARTLAEEVGDATRRAQVLYWLGRIDYVRGRPPAAIDYARRSLEIAESLQDEGLAALPVNLMGRIYWQQSDFARAAQLLGRSAEQMRQLGNKTEESTAAGFAGVALAYLGDFEQAMEYVTRGVQVAVAIQNPFAEASARLSRGVAHGERGDWPLAFTDFEQAQSTAERMGDAFRLYLVKLFAGRSHTMAGHPERARVLLEESAALAGQIGSTFALAWQKSFLAQALLALGALAAVPPLCQETIRLAAETGDRFPGACAQRTLAEALLRQDPARPEQAEVAIQEAMRIHREIGARPELARTYVTHAHLLAAAGRAGEARARLTEARTMFEGMRMLSDMEGVSHAL